MDYTEIKCPKCSGDIMPMTYNEKLNIFEYYFISLAQLGLAERQEFTWLCESCYMMYSGSHDNLKQTGQATKLIGIGACG